MNSTPQDRSNELYALIDESTTSPLVVVFSASWHSHSPIVEIITEKIEKADPNLNVISFDADLDENVFEIYNIDTVPSAIIIKDKKMIRKIKGTFSKKTILDAIKE